MSSEEEEEEPDSLPDHELPLSSADDPSFCMHVCMSVCVKGWRVSACVSDGVLSSIHQTTVVLFRVCVVCACAVCVWVHGGWHRTGVRLAHDGRNGRISICVCVGVRGKRYNKRRQ